MNLNHKQYSVVYSSGVNLYNKWVYLIKCTLNNLFMFIFIMFIFIYVAEIPNISTAMKFIISSHKIKWKTWCFSVTVYVLSYSNGFCMQRHCSYTRGTVTVAFKRIPPDWTPQMHISISYFWPQARMGIRPNPWPLLMCCESEKKR